MYADNNNGAVSGACLTLGKLPESIGQQLAKKEPEISRLLNDQAKHIEDLHAVVVTLENALKPILRNVPTGANEKDREAFGTDLGNAIAQRTDIIEHIKCKVLGIIERIEV